MTLQGAGAGTLPSPQSPAFSQLDAITGDPALGGHYVPVPAGAYVEDFRASAFRYTSSTTGKTYQDGFSLTDGVSTVLVDTYSFQYSPRNCLPTDGGEPDLSAGGFNGIVDTEQTDDGNVNQVVIYGQCGQ